MGCTLDQDYPNFVSFKLGDGSSSLALYGREAAARDAGVSPEGSGFQGVSFHFIVPSSEAVDEVMANAVAAGGAVVKNAVRNQWAYFGYFSDLDGYLWKVASASLWAKLVAEMALATTTPREHPFVQLSPKASACCLTSA